MRFDASKATPQYGFRKGLDLFCNEDYQAAKDKLKENLLGRRCIDILSIYSFTLDIRKQALGYLMFLKRKRSRKMKERGFANKHLQQECITKEESSLPTLSLYALMGSCVVDRSKCNSCLVQLIIDLKPPLKNAEVTLNPITS